MEKRLLPLFILIILSLALLPLLTSCGTWFDDAPVPTGGGGAAAGLTVYFIDVGQADSSLVLCDGAAMLIDGGNAADSDLIYAFLESRGVSALDYIVATHAHEDHVGGLAGALNYASAGVAYAPVTEHDSEAFGDFVTYLNRQGVDITVPEPGDTFVLGGASVEILGPHRDSDNINDTSIVLKLTYGEVSFLFTGDCERDEEADILEAGGDLSADVLKVGHHGSESSTGYPFLREIMPRYAVISCGRDNSYGHPHEDTLSRLRDAGTALYRTDMQGTVTAVSDGSSVTITTERNAGARTNPTGQNDAATAAHAYYIGNANTKVLHSPDCGNLPAEKNRVIFDTWDAALTAGYEPHDSCIE